MIVKYAKYCKEGNCKKYAYYNFPNEKKKLYCRILKKDNMMNKINKKTNIKCKYLNCKKKIFVINTDINAYLVTQE